MLLSQPLCRAFWFNVDILSTLNRAVVVAYRCSLSFLEPVIEPPSDLGGGHRREVPTAELGANKANGQRLTTADKRHAILLALETWPEKSARQIADQIGVNHDYVNDIRTQVSETLHLPDRVVGKDGKSYPAARAFRESERRLRLCVTCPMARAVKVLKEGTRDPLDCIAKRYMMGSLRMAPKELAAFRLPPQLLEALREIRERDGISMTDQVHRALDAWVESRGVTPKKTGLKRTAIRKKP